MLSRASKMATSKGRQALKQSAKKAAKKAAAKAAKQMAKIGARLFLQLILWLGGIVAASLGWVLVIIALLILLIIILYSQGGEFASFFLQFSLFGQQLPLD